MMTDVQPVFRRGYRKRVRYRAEELECDLWYIDNWSLRLDFWIIVRAVLVVMRGHNAY